MVSQNVCPLLDFRAFLDIYSTIITKHLYFTKNIIINRFQYFRGYKNGLASVSYVVQYSESDDEKRKTRSWKNNIAIL